MFFKNVVLCFLFYKCYFVERNIGAIGSLDHYAIFSTVKLDPGDITKPSKLLAPGPP